MRNPLSAMDSNHEKRNNSSIGGGGPTPCCSKVGMKRGPWTPEEDELLSSYIKREGDGRWRTLPKRAGLLRCGKSCRLRWMNYLRPSVKRGHITSDEEDLILRLHRLLGNRWSLIAGRIPGRTDNEIKNYWNTHLSKKLISQGIDPRTHKPLSQSSLPNPNNNPSFSPPPPHHNNIINNINQLASSSKPPDPHQNIPNPNPKINAPPPLQTLPSDAADKDKEIDNLNPSETNKSLGRNDDENEEDGDGIDNNYTDDIFSSFLDSLISIEDMYNGDQNQLLLQDHDPNAIAYSGSDILISPSPSSQMFTFGAAVCDAPIMSSPGSALIHQHDHPKDSNDNIV